MRSKIKVLALLLAIMMFLCACDFSSIPAETGTESSTGTETTVDSGTEIQSETESETELETESETEASTYRQSISRDREELEAMLTISDEDFTEAESLLVEFEEMALSSTDVEAINAISEEFEEKYDFVATQISIASVIYYLDMSDEEASARYLDNYDKYGDMYNSYMAHCKKVYEESPVRDELFADWTEEEIKMLLNFSPETTALTIRNEEITDEINNLSAGEFKDKSAELYAELVTNYNKIAKLYGYDNYYDYATKEIYGRDFGQEELEYFSKAVAEQYLPKYSLVYTRARSNISMLTSEDRKLFNGIMYGKFDGLETNYLVNYINSLDGSMKE